jgi:predicted nucleotidyltransferase
MRSDPLETARLFVEEHFPEARAAIVGGSVIRGEGTPTSDLDIVVISDRDDAPLRASYRFMEWPIEVFVHTEESLPRWMLKDAERRRPSMAMMCAEGVAVRGDELLVAEMKAQGRRVLDAGPPELTPSQIEDLRYALTDLLDDFLGVTSPTEGIFSANALAVDIADFTLALNGKWLGSGKWVPRALRRFDPDLTDALVDALRAYYRTEEKGPLSQIAERTLDSAGGRLFEGYFRHAET